MKKWKKTGVLFLLIILTVGVVFIPQLISKQREEQLLNEIVYRDYNAGQRPKLSGEQIARLYYNRQIEIKYNSLQDNSDAAKIQEDVMYLTELLFSKETAVCEAIAAILEENALSYFRSSSLILVDNQPTALNFVSCSVKGNDAVLEILYEEKTQTIIGFSLDSPDSTFHRNGETDLYAKMLESLINSYFEEQLHVSRDEYYCSVAFSEAAKTGENSFAVSAVIRCGIRQLDEKAV